MELSKYKDIFEKEFLKDVKPPKDYYRMFSKQTESYSYDLDAKLFYGIERILTFYNDNNELVVKVKRNNVKTLYLTYLTLNTKFGIVPEKTLVDVTKTRAFYINIEMSMDKNMEVIPYIIQYNSSGKKNMKSINRPMQYFKVDEDVIKLRLAFKFKGFGNFILRSITRRDVK